MPKSERTKWGLCFGVMGSLALAGLAVGSISRTAQADPTGPNVIAQRAPTPGGPARGNTVAAGRARYDRACGRCHPGGEEDIGPRLTGKLLTEERMIRQIRQGTGRMRPISLTKLPEAEMPAVLSYLRSIRAVR